MEVARAKRPAETNLPSDKFTICPSCTRLNVDSSSCDTCGCAFSTDTVANGFPSDPKRPCISSTSSGSVSGHVNGVSSSSTSNACSTTACSSVSNSNSDTSVRPQALYVNVNNQAFPVLSVGGVSSSVPASSVQQMSTMVSSTATASHSATRLVNSASTMVVSAPQTAASSVHSSGSSGNVVVGNLQFRPLAPAPTTTSVVSFPTYNLQPPLPPIASSVTRLPGVMSATTHAPLVTPPTGAPVTSSSSQIVQVTATQIRIGPRKFKPISTVTFKEDGILFTLTGYTYAPVLLNARAILKCKANLNTFSYPVLFLFLECSCMRQIRSIFGLTSSEFSANSEIEMNRCISIFPVFLFDGKSQAQTVMYTIRRCFESMVRRYPRSTPILEEISNDQVIDMLLDSNRQTDVDGRPSGAGNMSPNIPVSVLGNVTQTPSAVCVTSSQTLPTVSVSRPTLSVASTSMSVLLATTTAGQTQSAVSARPAPLMQVNRPQSAAPVLQIPSDQSRWQLMQKNLIAGGVYHVMMPDGGRQYCLWNGKQLVPCLVQNTEVQLGCAKVRIGSLLTYCVGQVRVRADQNCGVFFTIKNESGGSANHEIALVLDDIKSCQICFSKLAVMFIVLTASGAENLRRQLKMQPNADPSYNPAGPVYRQYILLFLTTVNRDQKDALKQMKFSRMGVSSSLFDVIDIQSASLILARIKLDCTNETVVLHYMRTKQLGGVLGFDKLMNDVASSASPTMDVNDDDDDDDLIMTQEELGIKCPYTQQVMKFPVRNRICGHNYERDAIKEFILRKKGTAKCPYAGCGNLVALSMDDLVENNQLRDYIIKQTSADS